MKTLTVGERFNMPRTGARVQQWNRMDLEVRCRFLRRCGVFNLGPSRAKLRRIGVRVTDGMNLTLLASQHVKWERRVAQETASTVLNMLKTESTWDYDVLYAVGRNVQKAFGLEILDVPVSFHDVSRVKIIAVPHPSGRNLFWNDPDRVSGVRDLIEEFHEEIRCQLSRSR